MPRIARAAPANIIQHVFNAAFPRKRLFRSSADFTMFIDLLSEGLAKHPCKLHGFALLPTHFHLVLQPTKNDQLSGLMSWLLNTHVRRHTPPGPLYPSRFRNFPVQPGDNLYSVLQWVESAPVREGLVDKAMDWPFSSLARTKLPIATPRPAGWVRSVNGTIDAPTMANLSLCLKRNRPFGDEAWVKMTAEKLGLNHTLNPIGRPRKTVAA